MKLRSTKLRLSVFNILAGSSLMALASAAGAQTPSGGDATASASLEEIIVTARRKDESAQDVPVTINAVTGTQIAELSIRKFEDLSSVIPGLSMSSNGNGIGATASVRGVNYDVNASGNNGTVEFYLNDAPISAGNLFQTVYDIQQVELLRGPQGTLRGRASPSGSMTVTTRRPDLSEFGGYVSGTGTDLGGANAQGAVSFPIVADKLAVRLAGVYDRNEGNRVHSVRNTTKPETETQSGRATISFEPIDTLSFVLTAQATSFDVTTFDQVQSRQEVIPGSTVINGFAGSPPAAYIKASDRLAVLDTPRRIKNDFQNFNLQGQWAFAGQKLNLVAARNEQNMKSFEPRDIGDYFSPTAPAVYQGFGQDTDSHAYATAYELRLSNEERIADRFDYIVGGFYQKLNTPTELISVTPVFIPPGTPGFPPTGIQTISRTPIKRTGGNLEQSVFANLTMQLFDATELSGGLRYIKYEAQGGLYNSGVWVPLAAEDTESNATIFNFSVRQKFGDDFMAYATVGSSWRPGISATGDFSVQRSPLETSFLVLPPEESTSYEIGVKADFMDSRLRASADVFYQTFDNYPYRSPSGVNYADYQYIPGTTTVAPPTLGRPFNFVGAVPVEVTGAELEVTFAATENWDMGVNAAVSKGEIKEGFIPCDDYNARDGVPDTNGLPPRPPTNPWGAADLLAATGGEHLSGCTVTQRSSTAPQWSATAQMEYRLPITDSTNIFFRGLWSIYGDSINDPVNSVDNYDGYDLLNLYAGLRSADGTWELSIYGKNVGETDRVLTTSNTTMSPGLNGNNAASPTNFYGGSNTTGLTMTAPREFGLTVRYAFGSR